MTRSSGREDALLATLVGTDIALLAWPILHGLVRVNESDLFVGARGPDLVALTNDETAGSWDVDLLESLAAMVSRIEGEIDRPSKLLTITQPLRTNGRRSRSLGTTLLVSTGEPGG